ncbi:lectin [Lysobacter terrae]
MRMHLPTVLLALSVAACTGQTEHRDEARNDTPSAAAPATPAPATASAGSDAAPSPSAPVASPAPAQATGPMPAPGTIGFAGFGPAKFGATQEEVRMAWGKDMSGAADEPGGCYYLQPVPEGGPVAFMMEGDRFVRIDVHAPAIAAPGGGQVGMTIAEIRKRYPNVQELPHKYDETGKYLRVKDPAGGNGVLVFETDGSGQVTRWRVGTAPQVDYVEGCA